MEWVEILQPSTKELMYANVETGECAWNPPPGCHVKKRDAKHWWQLYDATTSRFYYYNSFSEQAVWTAPFGADVIPLVKLQMLNADCSDAKQVKEQKNALVQTSFRLSNQNNKRHQVKSMAADNEVCNTDINSNMPVQLSGVVSTTVDSIPHQVNSSSGPSVAVAHRPDSFESQVVDSATSTGRLSQVVVHRDLPLEAGNVSVPIAVDDTTDTSSQYSPQECLSGNLDTVTPMSQQLQERNLHAQFTTAAPVQPSDKTNGLIADVQPSDVVRSLQFTPRSRKAFPRTNPSYVGLVKRVTGTPSGSASINRTGSNPNLSVDSSDGSLKSYQAIEQRMSESDLASGSQPVVWNQPESEMWSLPGSSSGREIGIDISGFVVDINGNEKTVSATSLSDLKRDRMKGSTDSLNSVQSLTPVTKITQDGSSSPVSIRSQPSSSLSPVMFRSPPKRPSLVSYNTDTRLFADADVGDRRSLNRSADDNTVHSRKSHNFIWRRLHRRQSSESDAEYLRSGMTNDFRKSTSTLETKNRPSTLIDMSILRSLNEHRVGFRRKSVSIANMLSWTKDPIPKPMFRTSDRAVKKEAVDAFKLIMMYMGDRSTKLVSHVLAHEIVCRGWSMVILRDEIFMQLIRQTSENPKQDSLIRGWELMAVCLTMFPPSTKFHSYLEGYISQQLDLYMEPIDSQDQVVKLANCCCKRLERITKTGARRGVKKPSVDEVQQSLRSIYNPSMFGSSLDEILQLQASRFPHRQLPWIQTVLSEEVIRLNGPRTEGIFRVSGDIDEVNHLKTRCDQWTAPTGCTDPHTPGSLLKLWYRELAEPLIPNDMYDQCTASCNDVAACVGLVDNLPPLNRLVFCYLIRFLQEFAAPESVAVTKMDASNLAMVWAPNCLRCLSGNPEIIFENARKELIFLRNIITNLDTRFMLDII